MSVAAEPSGASGTRRGRWIDDWRPEDTGFWESTGKKIANRNLWFSVFSEHIGFSIWSLWAVLVLFMPEATYHIDTAGKFFLVSMPTLIGSLLRLPYTMAVAVFGGRNWTIVSAGLLLVPSILAAIVMHPGTSYTTFMIVAAIAGVGGGNFASSMTNINAFFPEKEKGKALGLNAGGGNLGVAVIQLVGLLIIATAGTGAPRILLAVYIPLIVIALLGAVFFMDNLSSVRNDTGALKESCKDAQTWIISFLYIGTFGSFIGYSFAFGLVLQNQFGRTPLQAATITFIGPLLGSLVRPVGGWLSDRIGGTRITVLELRGDGGQRADLHLGLGHPVARAVRGRLRAAVHHLGHRQRLGLQDDPGDLPDEGAGLLRGARPGPGGGAAVGPAHLRRRHGHRGRDRRFGGLLSTWRSGRRSRRPSAAPPRSGRSSPSTRSGSS